LAALGETDVPTREELAEARMFVVAVDGKQQVGLTDEVEVGLGLLRLATHGELSAEAKQRIWQEIPLPVERAGESGHRVRWFSSKWLALAGLLPAAAAVLIYWQSATEDNALVTKFGPDAVPEPNAELLAAQAKWVASNGEREVFESKLSSYRLAVLEGLE
jgi:hypothetical protein